MIIDLKLLTADDLSEMARASGYNVNITSAKFVDVDDKNCANFDVTIKGSRGEVGASVCVHIGKDGTIKLSF